MGRIKIHQEIDVYEKNEEEVNDLVVGVDAHWNDNNFIVLIIKGTSYAINGDDLILAAENAMRNK